MKQQVFTGCAVAIVTPFCADGIDLPALRRLIERQIENGTDAIVICGTTGEAATLTSRERTEVIRTCVETAAHRVPVIAGSGSNATAHAIALSQEAEALGVDALLAVTPYYNKATQSGLVRHFTAIAERIGIPLILYNVPSRTGVSCTAETYAELAKVDNIVGVKEASGNFALVQDTLNRCPTDFSVWSGNDEDTLCLCALGARGVISVAANLVPREMHELTSLCLAGDYRSAAALQLRLTELIRALFCEVNPIPIKEALASLGLCESTLRLPLCGMNEANRARLLGAMHRFGIEG